MFSIKKSTLPVPLVQRHAFFFAAFQPLQSFHHHIKGNDTKESIALLVYDQPVPHNHSYSFCIYRLHIYHNLMPLFNHLDGL